MYATDTDALLNQINALYCSINPYPWVDVLEDNTVAEEEPDEEPNKKPNEGPDDTIMKQLLSLLVYTNYCGNTTVQSDYELFSKDMHDFFVYNDNFSEQLISFIAENRPNCITHAFSLEEKQILIQIFSGSYFQNMISGIKITLHFSKLLRFLQDTLKKK